MAESTPSLPVHPDYCFGVRWVEINKIDFNIHDEPAYDNPFYRVLIDAVKRDGQRATIRLQQKADGRYVVTGGMPLFFAMRQAGLIVAFAVVS